MQRMAILALVAALSAPAAALDIGGRLTSSLYTYEGPATDSTSASYLRAYQTARLDLGRLLAPALSLHTYVRASTDLSEKAGNDPGLHLFSAYLQWKGSACQVRAGRQRVHAGVGYGAVDGVRGDWQRAGLDLTLHAGLLAPADLSAAPGTWDEGHLWGARLYSRRFLGTDIALSFAQRQRQRPAYTSRYTGLPVTAQDLRQRLAGLDLNRRFAAGHNLHARLDYDLEGGKVRRSEVSGRWALSPRLSLQGEWFRRAPAALSGSFFGAFSAEAYQELGGRLYWSARPGLQLSAHLAALLYEGDEALRFGLSTAFGQRYTLGYYRSSGYARARDGLFGSFFHPLGRRLLLRGELDLSAYERYQDAEQRDALAAGSLGLDWRPTSRTSLEAQLQILRNPGYTSDLRLFLRGSWRFFKRGER